MIGKIYKAFTPYFNQATHKMTYKARPALVLAKADQDDYVVLPVSTISIKANIDPCYDVEVDPALYPQLNLDRVSYIRTHKQTIVHRANFGAMIGDLKTEYEDLYFEVVAKREAFSNFITNQSL